MAVLYPQVQLPNPAAFRVPQVDSSWLGNLPESYNQGGQIAQQIAERQFFNNPANYTNPDGSTNITKAAAALLRFHPDQLTNLVGGFQYDPSSGSFMQKPSLLNYGGQGGAPGQPVGNGPEGAIPAATREADAEFAKENNEYTSTGRTEALLGEKALGDVLAKFRDNYEFDPKTNEPKLDDNGQMILKPGKQPLSGPVPTSYSLAPSNLKAVIGQNIPGSGYGNAASLGQLYASDPGYFSKNYQDAYGVSTGHKRAALGVTRGILGSQRGQGLYQQVIDSTFSLDAPPITNYNRVKDFLTSVQKGISAKDAKARFFNDRKTLQNYIGDDPNAIFAPLTFGSQPSATPETPQPQGGGAPQQASMAPRPQASAPPPQAVAYLRAHPETAAAFQQKYGADPRQFLAGTGR